MQENLSEFRIKIDGKWSSRDMSAELTALTFFHDAFYLASELYPSRTSGGIVIPTGGAPIRSALAGTIESALVEKYAGSGVQLQISEIQYGSPGFQDFLGIAKIVQEVLNFVRGLISIGHETEKGKLELQEYEQKILKMKLDNLASFLRTLRDNGVSEDEVKSIIKNFSPYEDIFIRLSSEKKLIAAENLQINKAA
jgi:hypothetical protein